MDHRIEQNKAQYNLNRQTTIILVLSSRNVGKYKVLTGEDVLPEKDLLEKAASVKRFEYSSLGCELKKETDIIGKHRGLRKFYWFNKKDDDEAINKEGKDDEKHQYLKTIITKI